MFKEENGIPCKPFPMPGSQAIHRMLYPFAGPQLDSKFKGVGGGRHLPSLPDVPDANCGPVYHCIVVMYCKKSYSLINVVSKI